MVAPGVEGPQASEILMISAVDPCTKEQSIAIPENAESKYPKENIV